MQDYKLKDQEILIISLSIFPYKFPRKDQIRFSFYNTYPSKYFLVLPNFQNNFSMRCSAVFPSRPFYKKLEAKSVS